MAAYHVTMFGAYGRNIPTDMDGYTYTTIREWMEARVDWGAESVPYHVRREWARKQASRARAAIREATAAIEEWRLR
jgi:hypothetical protein